MTMTMASTLLALCFFIFSASTVAIDNNLNDTSSKSNTPTLSSVLSGILATLNKSKTPVTVHELLDALNKAGDDMTALLGGQTVDHDEVSKVVEECSKENDTEATISMEGFFSFESKDLATALGQLKCLALQAGRPNANEKTAKATVAAIRETTATIEAILDSVAADIVSGIDGKDNDRVRRDDYIQKAVKHYIASKLVSFAIASFG